MHSERYVQRIKQRLGKPSLQKRSWWFVWTLEKVKIRTLPSLCVGCSLGLPSKEWGVESEEKRITLRCGKLSGKNFSHVSQLTSIPMNHPHSRYELRVEPRLPHHLGKHCTIPLSPFSVFVFRQDGFELSLQLRQDLNVRSFWLTFLTSWDDKPS